jgi:hypothetical protein
MSLLRSVAARYIVGSICLFHILAVMGYLVREGRLSIVPIYDDVAYLVDGLKRLATLDQSGIGGFLASFWTQPAHAPFSALTSTLGFLVTGGAVWGPYLLNSIWVIACLFIAMAALRRAHPWSVAGIVVAILAAPIFAGAVTEFRPDPVWGLLVGFSLLAMTATDLLLTPLPRLFALGLLFGAAVLSKPTAAPASVAVLGVGFIVQVALRLAFEVQRPTVAVVSRRVGIVALGALVVMTPYFLASGAEILSYVLAVMRTESNVWGTNTSTTGHLTYYLNRETGSMMLGWIWYLFLPILLFCGVVLAMGREKYETCGFAALMAALLVAYVIVTVSKVKTPMIGSILYGVIIAAVTWSLGHLASRIRARHGLVLLLGVVTFATQWHPRGLSGPLRTNPAMLAVDHASKATFPVVLDALRAGAKTVLVTVPGPVYDATLDFFARKEGVAGNYVAGYTWNNWERFVDAVALADVVILSEAGMLGQSLGGFNFPSVQFQGRLLDLMKSRPEFAGKPVFTDSQDRSVWVFVRRPARGPA